MHYALGESAIPNLESMVRVGQAGNYLGQTVQPYSRLSHPFCRLCFSPGEVGQAGSYLGQTVQSYSHLSHPFCRLRFSPGQVGQVGIKRLRLPAILVHLSRFYIHFRAKGY